MFVEPVQAGDSSEKVVGRVGVVPAFQEVAGSDGLTQQLIDLVLGEAWGAASGSGEPAEAYGLGCDLVAPFLEELLQ
ncbi:hypothetical protein OG693_39380 (plasmid) [Streptomyces sp. NBC_01259]|uniref:hypothetical protein n=1 Tax=Streptomyces sp. NBC_01259 TaxID=2903800 RepID=UPI00324D65B1